MRTPVEALKPTTYRVTLTRSGRYGQWSYFTRNPQDGGFGTNTNGSSMGSTIRQAVQCIPVGTPYELVIHGRSRGVFIRDAEGRNPLSAGVRR